MLKLADGMLSDGVDVLLRNVPAHVTLEPAAVGTGGFLRLRRDRAVDYWRQAIGTWSGGRFLAAHRNEPFWMRPAIGSTAAEIPIETQFLFIELASGRVALIVPLISGAMRCSLEGSGDDVMLVAESGTPAITADDVTGLFVAVHRSLNDLVQTSAAAIAQKLGVALRTEKRLPDFIDEFGWCTWDAFYQEVSPEKIRAGLESFAAIGVCPRLLIIDDGWQSEENLGEEKWRRLTDLLPNAKFAHDLLPTTRMAKNDFGVQHVIVWHALQGYWGGVDIDRMARYQPVETTRDFSAGIRHYWPEANSKWWGATAAIIPPAEIARFFDDYHALLKHMNVDGVKVDNQAALEGLAGNHGRVSMYQQYRRALDTSAAAHFGLNLLHCMSCTNDLLYAGQPGSVALTRTSTDFWPTKPETHGLHVWTNAAVGTWFGPFVHADWDMFQSGHGWAAFHAAARAVSGGPVYVSDKPGQHDATVLRQLVLSDGGILRCDQPGALTRDCLFIDPTREALALKIWNTNNRGRSGVLGVFNCRYSPGAADEITVHATARVSDIPPMIGERFVVRAAHAGWARTVHRDDPIDVTLGQGGWEILSATPLRTPAVALGLIDKLNGSAAILEEHWQAAALAITVRDSGRLAVWSLRAPRAVTADGIPAHWTRTNDVVEIEIPPTTAAPRIHVTLHW